MGTIVERPRKNRTVAYMAKIIIKRDGKVVHRESQTFDRRPAAAAWIARREDELGKPGALERRAGDDPNLADVIDKFLTDISVKPAGRSKAQALKRIKEHDIAERRCSKIASHDIVSLAEWLRQGARGRPCSPSSVNVYMSHLSAVFAVAKSAWGYPLDKATMDEAALSMAKLGMTRRSNMRSRRPTLEELDKLMTHFRGRRKGAVPMDRIIAFAIFSTRREGEIVGMEWRDLDEEHSRVMVRDMKDPQNKIGNNVWCDLPPEALRIVKTTPRIDGEPRVFPYSAWTICTAFADARKLLGIADLRFHDLRHEGISRLFELGWNIPHVSAVSGHRSWSNLKRYTHIRARNQDKYAGWKWLDHIAPPEAATDA